jgi:hypothetical protein
MSTDILTFQARYYQTRRDLEHERAMRSQAEDRVRELEEATRRAEERVEHLENEIDGRDALIYKLLTPRLRYFDPDLDDQQITALGDHTYDLHAQGFDIDDTLLGELVNDRNQP